MRPRTHPTLLAELAGQTPARLVKKLDADPAMADGWSWREDGVETPSGELVSWRLQQGRLLALDDLVCSCLLAPRCLHRLAVLAVLEPAEHPPDEPFETVKGEEAVESGRDDAVEATLAQTAPPPPLAGGGAAPPPEGLSEGQRQAARQLWNVACELLQGGAQACGVVAQGQLLRAAFACREAGLHRAQAAATRVLQGVRELRAEEDHFSLESWAEALGELLLVSDVLERGARHGASWLGTARRQYQSVGNLKLHGLFCEPVATATGYSGVVSWFYHEAGRLYQLSDVAPGDGDRVLQAYRAGLPLAGLTLPHRELSRSVLLLQQATASPEGRLGTGRKVRGAVSGVSAWDSPALEPLWRSGGLDDLLFFEAEVVGAERDALVVDTGSGSLRLQEPPSLGELPGRHNLAVLARNPGMRCRWIARLHPGRTRSAVALALESQAQDSWRGRCNLGCDRLHASYFPALTPSPQMLELPEEPRPFAELTRAWQRVALAGRSALCGRGQDALAILLQRRGQRTAATLWRALCQAAGQGQRDLLGLWRPGPAEEVSLCWLALHVYLQAASREWSRAPGPETATDQSGR